MTSTLGEANNNNLQKDEDVDFLTLEELPESKEDTSKVVHKVQIVWRNVALFSILHIGSMLGIYCIVTGRTQWKTILFGLFLYVTAALSITAGAHRLWSHKSYKAHFSLRAILLFFNCIAFQNDIIEWSRDHRCHHKWSDTNGDPHNSNRGFFFSHMGWLLVRKHPELIRRGRTLDLSDLYADNLLVLQRKFYPYLVILLCFIMPTVVPVYFWGENLIVAYLTAGLLRYTCSLHGTWCVNSVAHKYGKRPYDKRITPAESTLTAMVALGEGFHNFHHTFPQDYRTSEIPWKLNLTTVFLDFFAFMGLAYARKAISQERIDKQKSLYGDGSGFIPKAIAVSQ